MKKALKSIISMVLVLAVVTGLLPQGLTDLADEYPRNVHLTIQTLSH